MNHALYPVLLAAADLGVGGLLYQRVSETLGVVLLVAGMVVLCSVVYEALSRGSSVLWRHVQRPPVSMT